MASWQFTVYLLPFAYAQAQPELNAESVESSPGWEGVDFSLLSTKFSSAFGSEKIFAGVRSFGKSEESCVWVAYDEAKNLIGEISVRLDLRRSIKTEVDALLDLCRLLNALLVTEEFKIISPNNLEELKEALRSSRAFRFVSDPDSYFELLSSDPL